MGGASFNDDVRDGGDTNGDQLEFSHFSKNDVQGAQELPRLQANINSMWWLIVGKGVCDSRCYFRRSEPSRLPSQVGAAMMCEVVRLSHFSTG